MYRKRLAAFFVLVTLVVIGAVERVAAAPPEGHIVVLKDDTRDVPAVAAEHARNFGARLRYVYTHALKGYAAAIAPERLAHIQNDPRVLFVSEDRPVSTFAETLPTGVDRIGAESSSHFNSDRYSIAVAVIDTGSGPHPDLNVVGGINCSTGKSFNDGNGHGTHVAGTIGARNNGAGVVGVAPGIPIYSVRVLNNAGSGSWSSVTCGIDWVTKNAATIKVANMSLGGNGSDDHNCGTTNGDALHKAICASVAAGVTYVVAAGNSNSDFAGSVPAAYQEVLTVTAMADFNGQPGGGAAPTCRTDVDDTSADFSNFTTAGGSDETHTIAAPGVCILSTWKGGGYNTLSGTSMATPHVTGTAALCIASGQCTGGPNGVITTLRSDAAQAATTPGTGFLGDPNEAITTGGPNPHTLYYGYLIYAGGY
jgi:subtilisin family serine protease